MNDRRSFLFEALALILGSFLPASADAEFLLECGCLWCGGQRQGQGWAVAFTVYIARTRPDGALMLRRMVPTELLRTRLEDIGVAVEFDGQPMYPALVGTSAFGPAQLHQRMAMALGGCDWTVLYCDPEPWEWREFDL
jgi:hypothetical protein